MRYLVVTLCLLLIACSKDPVSTPLFSDDLVSSTVPLPVSRDTPVTFPDDHQSHPAFDIEWWYLTFVVEDEQGHAYGLQYTLFRFRNDREFTSNWSDNQQWMGHASLHTQKEHIFEERFAAGGTGSVTMSAMPFQAEIDNWQWLGETSDITPSALNFTILQQVNVSLNLTATGPLIKHGENGYSIKSADERYRSFYYSQPFINATGTLLLRGETFSISGKGWFDHEWTSELVSEDVLGWDWFSLHLDNGDKLMAFRMKVNGDKPYITGSYITSDGVKTTLKDDMISVLPSGYETINEKRFPVNWEITVPSKKIALHIKPFKQKQYNDGRVPYYEGRITVSGSHQGTGFLELTGY